MVTNESPKAKDSPEGLDEKSHLTTIDETTNSKHETTQDKGELTPIKLPSKPAEPEPQAEIVSPIKSTESPRLKVQSLADH